MYVCMYVDDNCQVTAVAATAADTKDFSIRAWLEATLSGGIFLRQNHGQTFKRGVETGAATCHFGENARSHDSCATCTRQVPPSNADIPRHPIFSFLSFIRFINVSAAFIPASLRFRDNGRRARKTCGTLMKTNSYESSLVKYWWWPKVRRRRWKRGTIKASERAFREKNVIRPESVWKSARNLMRKKRKASIRDEESSPIVGLVCTKRAVRYRWRMTKC